MLSQSGCARRRERLWEELPKEVEWVMVADPRHVNYLCGFWVNPLSNSAGERGLLFLERGGESVLICDDFALASAIGDAHVDRKVVEPWYGRGKAVPDRDRVLFHALERFAAAHRACHGLVEADWFPLGALAALGPLHHLDGSTDVPLGVILRRLRRRKEPDEIDLLNRCFRAGEAGHRRAREVVRPGVSEEEVYREVQSAALAQLGTPGLVYGDFRATTPAHPEAGGLPSRYVMREGDTFILDYSVVVAGYRSDFTNSIAVGKTGRAQRELMDVCRTAMAAGERALRPGVTGAEVYQAVNAPLAAAGWPLPFHAGHGLGLCHPEAPAFIPESSEVVVSGDVVTLEPGAYVAGVGGVRIENNYLITSDGCERLTNHAIEL
jgi:Xaa-Pro aminopeptidase